MGSLIDLMDRMRPNLRVEIEGSGPETATSVDTTDESASDAFVLESDSGHLFLTGPASVLPDDMQAKWERASKANDSYLYLQGRYVEADTANRNLAYWSTEDLQMGQPTVANGPLNWLHSERHIIGVLTDSHLVGREAAAEGGVGTHIVAMSTVWKFLYPEESQIIQKASMDNSLWYSMECISEKVVCMDTPGRPGCGGEFDYRDAINRTPAVCSHVREKSSVRRYVNPTFLGGAVIVPPVAPGWSKADARVSRQVEAASLDTRMDRKDAETMVAMLLQYANGR